MSLKDYNIQRARRIENGFVWFIVTLIVLVNLFVLVPASAADECLRADRNACVDLLNADVTFSKVGEGTFEKHCGELSDACAVVNISKRQCTIYYKTRSIDKYVLEHELNHCRGWFHKGNSKKAYRNPWVDYKTYLGG